MRYGIGVIVLLVVMVGVLLASGTLRRDPTDAVGMIRAAKLPSTYSYETQLARSFTYDDDTALGESAALATVNQNKQQFVLTVTGEFTRHEANGESVLEEAVVFRGNGEGTERLITGQDSVVLAEPMSPSAVALPSNEQLLAAKPTLVSSTAVFAGRPVWVISLEPTPELIKQLSLANALQTSSDDLTAIEAGTFKNRGSQMLIERNTRQILMIDLNLRLKSELTDRYSVAYRVLTQIQQS